MFVTACTLRSAIGEYEVLVHNDSVSFPSTAEPVIVAVANNTPNNAYLRKEGTVVPSTLVGISDFALGLFTSRVAFESPHGHFTSQSLGVDAHKHAVPSDNDECPSFNDPRIDVIKSLNGLMIYIGAFAAKHNASYAKSHIDPGLELNTTTLGYLQGSHSVYQSSYGFFALAAALVAFTLGLIGSTYWGWWRYAFYVIVQIFRSWLTHCIGLVGRSPSLRWKWPRSVHLQCIDLVSKTERLTGLPIAAAGRVPL
jgi:hypothetical protein